MIHLSKTAWNNVLIYAVLALIGLFVILPEYIERQQPSATVQLVSAQQQLLALHFPGHRVERAGPSWRIQPADISQQDTQVLVQYWQQQMLPTVSPLNPIQPELMSEVLAWLTDKPAQQRWQLFQAKEQWWLYQPDNDHWYRLTPEQAKQLFPEALR